MNKNVGWVGFGSMGRPMVHRIISTGYTVHVCPRSDEQAEQLTMAGAVIHSSLAEVGEASDVAFSIVPGPCEANEVWTGTTGLLRGMRPGSTGVEMSTIGSATICDVSDIAARSGVNILDSPVSGGINGATAGSLALFVGGPDAAVDSAAGLLGVLGTIYRTGETGSGQVMKLVNQALVGANTYGLCLGWALAQRNGLDPQRTFEALTAGAADGRLLRLEWPMLINNDYTSGFAAAHMAKDLGMLSEFCRASKVTPNGIEEIHTAFRDLAAASAPSTATQALGVALSNPASLRGSRH